MMGKSWLLLLLVAIMTVSYSANTLALQPNNKPRKISAYRRNFFNKLLPIVQQVNQQVLANRNSLLAMPEKDLTPSQVVWLNQLAQKYRLADEAPEQLRRDLLQRVDIIPPSLVLAQAADESAWGRSRFAIQGHNLFGQWCYTEGCGIVPYHRSKGLHHQVRVFDSVDQSVIAYMRNLNSNPQYAALRRLRAQMRSGVLAWSGLTLAEGLKHYSARGNAYVRDIQGIIRENQLQRFDPPFKEIQDHK